MRGFTTLWCSFAVLVQGKRTHTTRTLEIQEDEKVDAWSVGEVVEWTQVQEELMTSMKTNLFINTEHLSPKETELRTALEKVGSEDECQMHGFLEDLIEACEAIGPKNIWSQKHSSTIWIARDPFEEELPKKTCVESAKDIFLYGNELVKTLAVRPQRIWENSRGRLKPPIPSEELKMVQSLWFLKKWLVPLATTNASALLWAGFWEEDPSNRTTKSKLFQFAKDVDHQTVHPDTELGRLIEKHEDLSNCYNDPKVKKLTNNMWSIASMSFVLGMQEKGQGTVVALLNKDIEGKNQRLDLDQSVLFRHEVPTVGVAAWGTDTWWSPQFLLIDMKGTCDKTSKLLRKQLFTRLSSWKPKTRSEWRDFRKKSEFAWTCINCPPGQCDLDRNLANYLLKIVKAQQRFKSSMSYAQ